MPLTLKKQTKNFLDALDDEQLPLAMEYLRLAFEKRRKSNIKARKMSAFEGMEKLRRKSRLSENFDGKRAIGEILSERYESLV